MRIVAYVVAALMLFAGCAQDKVKEPGPTSKPSPTVTVPTMPVAAQENTVAGAVAFVEHYIDVFNYASNTGDVKELQKLSDPACDGCTGYINLYRKTYADGGYFKNSDWKLDKVTAEIQGSEMVVFAHLSAPKGEYKKSNQSAKQTGDGENADVTLVPAPTSSGWILTQMGFQTEVGS